MRKINIITILSSLLLLMVACDSNELNDYRQQGELPRLNTPTLVFNGCELTASAALESDGGSRVVEYGVCYNLDSEGEPSHQNPNSRVKAFASNGASEFELKALLAPEQSYHIRVYALNAIGFFYSEAVTLSSGEADLNLLLEGDYKAPLHRSYFEPTPYEENTTQVYKKGDRFYVKGLGCKPLDWPTGAVDVELEINPEPLLTDSGKIYPLRIPLQRLQVEVEKDGMRYPLLVISGKWLLDDSCTDQEVTGHLRITDKVEIFLQTGYAYVLSDPQTDEILLDSKNGPKELIVGPQTLPTQSDPDLEVKVPRPACKLVRTL